MMMLARCFSAVHSGSYQCRRWSSSLLLRRPLPLPIAATSTSTSTSTTPASLISSTDKMNSITKRWHGGPKVDKDAPTVSITFVLPDGETKRTVEGRVGESLLQTAHRHDLDLEGACEGVCACSTCHLIFPTDVYDELEEPSEDEEDMLDMAFGLTETSRLGCQVNLTEDMDGITIEMPKATRNFYVDGHIPQNH